MAKAAEFKKTFSAGFHVAGGVVGIAVGVAEKVLVEFGERGPLVAIAFVAGDATDARGAFHGAESGEWGQIFVQTGARIFIEDNWAVKCDVVADVKGWLVLFNLIAELIEGVFKRDPALAGDGGGDAVDAGGFGGNGEVGRIDDVVFGRQLIAIRIIKCPAN